jgi:predicted Zn-dependent protease
MSIAAHYKHTLTRLVPMHFITIAATIFFALTQTTLAQLPAGTSDASSSSSQPQQSDPLRDEASKALAQHDYPTALKLLTTLNTRNPNDPQILYDLATAQDALSQNTAAIDTYRRAIAAAPTAFEPHLALALLLARTADYKAAHAELSTAVTLDVPDPALKARAYRTLARLDLSSDPATASADLLAALKLSPETPDDILLAGEIAESASQTDAAEASYRRLLAADPANLDAASALAHLLLRQNKPAEAEPLLQTAIAAHPDDPAVAPLQAQLAAVYLSSSDPAKSEKALALVQQLHADHPSDPAITRMYARLLSHTGDYAQAEQLFSTLIAVIPSDPTLLDDRADALIHLKRPAEAQALLKRALADPKAFPSKEELGIAAGHLAFAANANNDPQGTLQALALRATVLPQSPSALFLAAAAHDKLHQVKEASDLYKQFLSVANGQFPDEEWEARHRLVTLAPQK